MIVARPPRSAVTSPVAPTVAMVASEVVQAMVRPVRTAPVASFNVALACVLCPARSVDALSVTATVATGAETTFEEVGAVTVTGTTDLRPSAFAVTFAWPAATPVTRPLALTVAMLASDEPHDRLRPVSGTPLTSSVVAVSCACCPATTARLDGETLTLPTGLASTFTPVVAILLSTRSSRSERPMERPVTVASPVRGTTSGAVETHSTLCRLRSTGLPSLSRTR